MMERVLDFILVPIGLIIMVTYHVWLLFKIINTPTKTIVGIHAINTGVWVREMMKDTTQNGMLAIQTLRNNIMSSTLLATTTITLSSVIGVLMTNKSGGEAWSLVVGDRSPKWLSLKFFSILVCFLVSFLLNVQSIKYYNHASVLINIPLKTTPSPYLNYVERIVNKGGYYWSLGLRAFYFAVPMFLWMFGPIPMLCSCVFLVFLLYFLDFTFESETSANDQSAINNSDDEEQGRS